MGIDISRDINKPQVVQRDYSQLKEQMVKFFLTSAISSLLVVLAFTLFPLISSAAELNTPALQLTVGGATEQKNVSLALEILFLLTVLSLAPAIVLTATSFTRILIVFHFVRQAMGVQQLPPNQVLVSLAIFMTVAIMYPVGKQINETALQPYMEERIDFDVALKNAEIPMRNFLTKHTSEKALSVFYTISQLEQPERPEDVPLSILVASFIVNELKVGFMIGFLIYIPFLMLDMVVSSILLAMGMMMLPPMMVSMPFKILLFVMVDGWNLLVVSLVNSFY